MTDGLLQGDCFKVIVALKYFEEANRIDPTFSLPYARRAHSYIILSSETMSPGEAFTHAKELTSKALQLDPNSCEVHSALGNSALQQDRDWVMVEQEFKNATSLNPSSIVVWNWHAVLLRVLCRFDQAIGELNTGVELDPLTRESQSGLCLVH
ncbi:MAG: hypothetical protein WA688_02710 [Thermoplasmata archaeon]